MCLRSACKVHDAEISSPNEVGVGATPVVTAAELLIVTGLAGCIGIYAVGAPSLAPQGSKAAGFGGECLTRLGLEPVGDVGIIDTSSRLLPPAADMSSRVRLATWLEGNA